MAGKVSVTVELSEWEANYLLEYLDEQADYDFRGPDPKVVKLRNRLQKAFDNSGYVRQHSEP